MCDADYDGCTGYDKYEGGARASLIAYEEPKPEPQPVVTEPPKPTNTTLTNQWGSLTLENEQLSALQKAVL